MDKLYEQRLQEERERMEVRMEERVRKIEEASGKKMKYEGTDARTRKTLFTEKLGWTIDIDIDLSILNSGRCETI